MPPVRAQALAPRSRAEAERLLPTLSVGKQTLERRILRARCLTYVESFDVAWAELTALHAQTKDPLLSARIAVDLAHLAYYLVRGDEVARLVKQAERQAAADPLMLAELQLAKSINRTAANEITAALTDARWAEDALAAAPRGAPEDLAHIALLRGEAEVAERILARAPKGFAADEHFRDFVRGIVKGKRGDPRSAVRMLDEVGKEFESRGMGHWSLGAAVHAAFNRESLVRGGGNARAIQLVRDIAVRGGEGFAYYLPDVAAWLGRAAEGDPQARTLAGQLKGRGDAAGRR